MAVLQVIIALGFKIDNERAIAFRKWANQIVSEYTIKGWVMDVPRLKDGSPITDKYFEHQLERIREIRLSERKFYQKVTDLYATAIDYDRSSNMTRLFYATVQNRMHCTVHGHTAAEILYTRVNAEKEYMGLWNWEDAPNGKIKKSDVVIAKNYLNDNELGILERMVNAFLDYAETQTMKKIPYPLRAEGRQSEVSPIDFIVRTDVVKHYVIFQHLHAQRDSVCIGQSDRLLAFQASLQLVQMQ